MYKQFFRFLKEAGVYELWYENRRKWLNSTKFIRVWGKHNDFFPPMRVRHSSECLLWYPKDSPMSYLANAFFSFTWENTPEGFEFWAKINKMWLDNIFSKKKQLS